MASLRDIRARIRSVKNTQQITKAMKMVAAAKLRRAQDAILAARPYAVMLDQVMGELAARADGALSHPLMATREIRNVELVVLTSDRGLAGGFNSNVLRRAGRFVNENSGKWNIRVSTLGRKANDFFRRRQDVTLRKNYEGIFNKVSYRTAADIASELTASFLAGEVDAVFVVYNEFLSAIAQRVSLVQLLPLSAVEASQEANAAVARAGVDFKYEPSRDAVLERLVPQALNIKVYRSMLESVASEHGARMNAMENATKNAGEMIGSLTLHYNRSRQALITKELMEIVSGAEALK